MKEFLFSYGTLQPGLAPPEIASAVSKLHWWGYGHVRGALYDLGDYPGAVLDGSMGKIWGQIFVLPGDSTVLTRLDEYEEFDPKDPAASQFLRRQCACISESGGEVKAWIYVYNRDVGSAPRLLSGDFALHQRSKS